MDELRAATIATATQQQQSFHGWKDWTNKNIFASSIDETVFDYGYQNQDTTATENRIHQEMTTTDEERTSEQPITALQAAWNVTNAIQGMFIVGLPIAVKVGGWWTIIAILGVAYLCYWSGILLIDCLYENNVKIRSTYQAVAEAYRPGMGRFVLCAQLTELLSTCIIYIVIAGDLLQSCVPSLDKSALMMLVTTALLGCAFLDSIRIVSNLSLMNAISHLIINAIIFIYCLFQVIPFTFDIRTMPTVIGVVVFGYTSHIFLPSLEGSMEDPTKFKWMLRWSHIIAAIFKSLFGLLGFLTFGDFTQKEISNSLPNQTFKVIVNLVLVIKALFSYPLPYFAAVHLLKDNLFMGTPETLFTSCYGIGHSLREWALCLRIILVLITLLMAMSVPYLIELMGLVGNITGTMLSFIWPAMFHLKLKGANVKESDRNFDKFIIGTGICLMTIGLYFSALELVQAIRYEER
ncbi:vesicular GABA transporter, putative,Uuncoordinated protein 47, putative [Brugia malayi]|uniref:Vesicular GABA transporter, putative,Uuncoordinated protein 47, putative n=1 Tax=Brugia malayi TaxID=6279 RepID=A0A4E9F3D8_BRUMA|nr:vesicular GABA transporter, putative,Uuncoordinated protein 47, putative [Brugia malayi]VIO90768.1 vesicular GABA transporter, putative,Uuncoordinated protein 47, putative [Brugia malayi]